MGRLLVLVVAAGLVLGGCGSAGDGDDADPTSTTVEGCVQTVRGCIDPDTIEPGECVPSEPDSDDCVGYRPPADSEDAPTTTAG